MEGGYLSGDHVAGAVFQARSWRAVRVEWVLGGLAWSPSGPGSEVASSLSWSSWAHWRVKGLIQARSSWWNAKVFLVECEGLPLCVAHVWVYLSVVDR